MITNRLFDLVGNALSEELPWGPEKTEWAVILTWYTDDRESKVREQSVHFERCRADEIEAMALASMRQAAAHSVVIAPVCGYAPWDYDEDANL